MIYIDTHVHIYNCFNTNEFFNFALTNFQRHSYGEDNINKSSKVIILTETKKENFFNDFHTGCLKVDDWKMIPTREENSFIFRNNQQDDLVIVQGKQIVTKENIEILCIGSNCVSDDQSITNAITDIKAKGAAAVIPWGFGKWWGKRGKILNEFLLRTELSDFFIGDNGGRTYFLPYPVQFRIAAMRGIKILPGSDPLPIYGEHKRAATYGVKLNVTLNKDYPARHIINLLTSLKNNPPYFGKISHPAEFIKRQALLRISKIS